VVWGAIAILPVSWKSLKVEGKTRAVLLFGYEWSSSRRRRYQIWWSEIIITLVVVKRSWSPWSLDSIDFQSCIPINCGSTSNLNDFMTSSRYPAFRSGTVPVMILQSLIVSDFLLKGLGDIHWHGDQHGITVYFSKTSRIGQWCAAVREKKYSHHSHDEHWKILDYDVP